MLVPRVDSDYRSSVAPAKAIRTVSYPLAIVDKIDQMKAKNVFRPSIVITALFFSILFPAVAQTGAELNMAVLSKKLQLTDQQKKQLAPIVEQRDKEIKALKAETSLGKLQKLRKAEEIQTSFRDQAAKILNPDQIKKLDELQAERRAKLVGH
jgi:hypothetical protein